MVFKLRMLGLSLCGLLTVDFRMMNIPNLAMARSSRLAPIWVIIAKVRNRGRLGGASFGPCFSRSGIGTAVIRSFSFGGTLEVQPSRSAL